MSAPVMGSHPGDTRRRSGRRRIVPWLAAVVVAALLVTAAVDIGYGITDPLVDGSVGSDIRICEPATTAPECAQVDGAALAPGARFQFLRTIRNTGAAPITILGVGLGAEDTFEWLPPATIKPGHEYLKGPDDIEDLVPVNLAPGQELTVLIRGRLRECAVPLPAGDMRYLDRLIVRYRLIAVEHTAGVDARNADPLLVPFDPCPGL